MATLKFTLRVEGLEDNSLVVRSFEGHEALSDGVFNQTTCFGFRFDIDLASRRSDLSPEQFIDNCAELNIYRNGELVQRLHGIVRSFTQGDTGHQHTFYSLTLVPAIERLSLRYNSRIFQRKTVPEIISVLFKEMEIRDFVFSVSRDFQQREFCVQYRETDLEFVHRLAAEEGLVYSHKHSKGKHTLVFSDNSELLPKLSGPVPYNALSGGTSDVPFVENFQIVTRSETEQVELQDRCFKKPSYNFSHQTECSGQANNYALFDFPGRYKNDVNGKVFSRIRLEYLRREAFIASGHSDQPLMRAGYRFKLEEHLNSELNRDWLLVSITHKGSQPQALEEYGGEGATTYRNGFKVIPANQTWRATPQPKPQVDGPMIATVVGPKGEEIYCDEYGRVKIHFPWDRYSDSNEQSSCWVRVSQAWAGSQYGMLALPRIGHEVIVSFLNGDPDQPIITGRTYHAANTPPYILPEHKTKTVLRSETHQGEGYNELSFEDQSGSELVYLHAQKDLQADVLNDHLAQIGHDQHQLIDNDSFTQVRNNQHVTVEGESLVRVSKDKTMELNASLQVKAGKVITSEAGSEVHIKAGEKVVIEAGCEITLKAGGSFVKIDPAGVHVMGPVINLNSGGSAGSGSGYDGKIAKLPLGISSPPMPVSSTPDFAKALLHASVSGADSFVVCGKQSDGSCSQGDKCRCK
ncbi:type VI secretion system tip protein VgrG [Vibrio sp. JC009]|uniref:type VI secretion system Vgr family protein n=1 Tax=Vibrio sp. JC009 TaxID=2912314 RepID=UPI0023AF8203|nr:type VI secretion system tip protein TssI/VgrG [Vibrio sp. JC009]WED22865.1 type VI secretion system tip protein VgrG [Vibrio sp. JC009]